MHFFPLEISKLLILPGEIIKTSSKVLWSSVWSRKDTRLWFLKGFTSRLHDLLYILFLIYILLVSYLMIFTVNSVNYQSTQRNIPQNQITSTPKPSSSATPNDTWQLKNQILVFTLKFATRIIWNTENAVIIKSLLIPKRIQVRKLWRSDSCL